MAASIRWQGPIGAGTDQNTWSGSISLDTAKLSASPDEYKIIFENSYLPTPAGAAIRCIDGRPAPGKTSKLGPQLAGGSPGMAIAWGMTTTGGLSVMDDFTQLTENRKFSFKLGAHIDDHAIDPFTGCGAIDKMAGIILKIQSKNAQPTIKELTKAIFGGTFDESTYTEVLKHYLKVDLGSYLPKDYRHQLLRLMDEDNEAIETVAGPHREIAVIVNNETDTTLDKESVSRRTYGEVQGFNYDYWASEKLAAEIFDDNVNRLKFLTAHVMFNLAAAMVLTDGSLELGIRSQELC